MALTLEGGRAVWDRVKIATQNSNEASFVGAASVFKAVKTYLATQGKNIRLQFCVIDGNVSASDGTATASVVLADSPCRLYALYLKKNGSVATWFKGSNHATTAATDGTQVITEHDANNDTVPVGMTKNEICRVFTNGKSLSAGLTITQNTSATGSTLTLAANRFDGFAIVGAP